MASKPKAQAELAKLEAQKLMDINNSASANVSDKLLSILEGGKGSSILRDQLDQFLHNHIKKLGLNAATIDYDWSTLRKCLSIKEKVAYTTGIVYAKEGEVAGINPGTKDNVDDIRIRKNLDDLIATIEKNLMNNQDFSESRVLRHAALNRFQCKLSLSETHKLNEFSIKVREVCRTNGLDNLAESTDFTHESDAQKILKISDALLQMSANGVNLDSKLLAEFEVLNEKIKPIRDLDKHYKHVTKTLNMLHRIAQKGYHSMVTPNQKDKVNKVLKTLGMTAEVNEAMVKFNDINNFEKNEEHGGLDRIIAKVQSKAGFRETITKLGISEGQFNSRFYSLYAFILTQNAKTGLDLQKGAVFGEELAHFEADTQSRRGMVRRKVFDIADRMVGNPATFAPNDFNTANSYFEKFRDLFFAKEEDNYEKGDKKLHYDKMAQVVSALVRQRVGLSISGDRIRKGSAGRKIYHWIESALSGKERGIKERIKRVRHSADDATVVAMVIMAQNEASNEIFYQDKNKNKKGDNRWGKLRHKVETAEIGRQGIREKITPGVNKTLTLAEETIKKGLKLTAGLTKVTNRVGSRAGKGLSYAAGGLAGKFNTMIKDGGYKRWKTLLYLGYPVTSIVEGGAKLGYKGATYMQKKGSEHVDDISKATEKGYAEAKDLVSKGTGQDTDYLFKGLTYSVDQATGLIGNTVSGAGKLMHDNYATGQKRSILGAFYDAAKEQGGLEDLMQSAELGEMLNLKARGPKLFDEDGRILATERVEKKEDDSPEGSAKLLSNKLKEQLDILIQQADKEINEKIQLEKKTYEGTDEGAQERAGNNVTQAKNIKNNINKLEPELRNLLPILKKPFDSSNKRRKVEIENVTTKINTTLTDPATGLIKKITDKIGDGTTTIVARTTRATATGGLEADLKVATEEKNIAMGKTKIAKMSLEMESAKRQKDYDPVAVATAKSDLNKADEELAKAETNRARILQELRNAKELLGRLEKIEGVNRRIETISTNMDAAITGSKDTKLIANEFLQMSKNMDILLHPIAEKEQTVNVKGLSEDNAKRLLADLNERFNQAA